MDFSEAKQNEVLKKDNLLRLCVAQFLNESNRLKHCINAIISYVDGIKSQKHPLPFRYVLEINFSELVEVSDILASLLLSEPHYINYLINHITHCTITTFTNIRVDPEDVIVSLRITLPPLPCLINSTADPNAGLFMIRGILISLTATSKHLQSTVFCCPVTGCDNNSDGVRVYNHFSNRKLKCSLCNINRVQIHSAQELIDQVIGVLIERDSLNPRNYNHSQGKMIFIRGDLCQGLILGASYDATVCYQDGCLTAWGMHRQLNNPQIRLQNDISFEPIPISIQNLNNYIRNNSPQSPWALTTALSLVLGAHLAPPECFMHLRAGILLSLASLSGGTNCQPIHLLCINPDGKRILDHCSKLATRTINSWSLDKNLASMTCLDNDSNRIWFDAGPLLLAGNGICYLGDWSNYESSNSLVASQIKQALENGEVKMEMRGGSRFGPCRSSPNYPIQCAIWTELHKKPNILKNKEKIKMRSITELFGMPFISDCDWDKTIEKFAKYRVTQATNKNDENRLDILENAFNISEIDLKNYLELVSSYPVTISPKASALLRKYFVTTRRTRPDCFPLSAIKIMTALAESHARISMRQEVTENDVIYIIYLYEQSITYLYGLSPFTSINSNFYAISSASSLPYSTILQQVFEHLIFLWHVQLLNKFSYKTFRYRYDGVYTLADEKTDFSSSCPSDVLVDNNVIRFSAMMESSLKYLASQDTAANQYSEE